MLIKVVSNDAATGQQITVADAPAEDLPQSFERDTTLRLGDDDWHVVKAEPPTAAEFTCIGSLVVTLAKLTMVPAKDILYGLPTICDVVPAVDLRTNRQGNRVFELAEDDWRQIEFIAESYRLAIEAQFAEIERILREQSAGNGRLQSFRDIFVRKDIADPLPSGITLASMQSTLPPTGLAYDGIGV